MKRRYTPDEYGLLPKSASTYLMTIGSFWYIGFSSNIYARAKHRKSVLKSGRCNERRVLSAFLEKGVLPSYELLSTRNIEEEAFDRFVVKLGEAACLNIFRGGENVGSHTNLEVYAEISKSLTKKAATDSRFMESIRKATKASAEKRMKKCVYMGKEYKSLTSLADSLSVSQNEVTRMRKRGEIILL